MAESKTPENPTDRGIPAATFIEDVPKYISGRREGDGAAAQVLKELHELYGKYKFMEANLINQKRQLLKKIPDIKNAQASLVYLMKKGENDEEVSCQFELADALYAKARVKNNNTVLLWLGANVMLEYSYDEANALLSKNLNSAKEQVKSLEKDTNFLKDQITVTEVNIARTHNFNVQQKKLSSSGK